MGFYRNVSNRAGVKVKFIVAAAGIVMGVVLLTALFNWTSLEKLCFDAYVTEFSIDADLLSTDLRRLAESEPREGKSDVAALLQRHQERIRSRIEDDALAGAGARAGYNALLSVSVVSSSGVVLDSTDPNRRNTRVPLPVLHHLKGLPSDDGPASGHIVEAGMVYMGRPVEISPAAGVAYGMISFAKKMVGESLSADLNGKRRIFRTALAAAILMMIMVLFRILPNHPFQEAERRKQMAWIIGCCILLQAGFSLLYAAGYRAKFLELVRLEARGACQEFIHRMAGAGPPETPESLEKRMDDAARKVISGRRGIAGISVTLDSRGPRRVIIARAPKAAPVHAMSNLFRHLYDPAALVTASNWTVPGVGYGEMHVFPSAPHLHHMLSEMVMDAITVLVISMLLFIELMFILKNVFTRKAASMRRKSEDVDPVLMRPAAFLFLFAIDLSMSFIPLYMERLYEPLLGLPKDVVLGLPITVEFIFVGLAIFGSGFWVDRRGWQEPFLAGMVLSILGLIHSWLAPDALQFILSRGVIGVGYGLALMASQGYVITFTDLRTKALGLAQLFAGIYAGSICGGAAGAMLADRFGYMFTFQVGAVIILGIIAYTFVFLRDGMQKPLPPASCPSAGSANETAPVRLFEFIRNRIVISLILLSSLPASIAVVGFLNYFCPLYLNGLGVTQSSIGRILMVYGVSMVYFGPIIGRYTDLSDDKRMFVFTGCILGSLTFLIFHVIQGTHAAVIALLLLGLSSCFVLSSQSAYLLNLKVTRHFGQGKAIGVFRSTSRIGQALGPLVFSGLILAQNLESGIVFFGLVYLVTALLFFLFTQRDSRYYIRETA